MRAQTWTVSDVYPTGDEFEKKCNNWKWKELKLLT